MTRIRHAVLVALLTAVCAGCAGKVDVEKIPIGTRVDVTREDGGVVSGTLTGRTDTSVQLAVGRATRTIARDQIASVHVVDEATAASTQASASDSSPKWLPAVARFREYTVPSGTVLVASLDSSIGSDTSRVEDPVEATLSQAAVVDGVEVLPVGSVLKGVVTLADKSGKVSGRASLAVQFQSITPAGSRESYALSAGLHHTAASTKKSDAKKIGIPAAGGAIVGALIGGGKGAAIGAGIGGGAGTAVVLSTSGPEVRYPQGTQVSLRIDRDVDVRMPIRR
jgi:hypothetical protein